MGIIPLTLGAWNVRTLMDRNEANRPQRRTALIGLDLARYNIDIAALSETLLADEGKLCEEALAIHYSGAAEEMKNEERLVLGLQSK